MEGKTVVLSVLIISLVMSQIQVEAIQACCPTTAARNAYVTCRNQKSPKPACASISGCIIVPYGACPGGYVHDILKNSGDDVTEYCKLGCTSSVCIALTNLQNSDASEIVNGAFEKCTEACSTFCTKGSKQALETVV